jgi:hypothetical protein
MFAPSSSISTLTLKRITAEIRDINDEKLSINIPFNFTDDDVIKPFFAQIKEIF